MGICMRVVLLRSGANCLLLVIGLGKLPVPLLIQTIARYDRQER